VADWLVHTCLSHLMTLFQLQRLYSIKRDETIVNSGYVRIWKKVIVAYFKVLSWHLTGLIWENYGKQCPAYSVHSWELEARLSSFTMWWTLCPAWENGWIHKEGSYRNWVCRSWVEVTGSGSCPMVCCVLNHQLLLTNREPDLHGAHPVVYYNK
jgi:hypothetical protein